MAIKLSVFSRKELEKLRDSIGMELNARDARRALAMAEGRDPVAAETEVIKQARYKHPYREELVWCGVGRMPRWMTDLIESGYSKEQLIA
jgi:DNA-binding protein H-NS